MKQAVFLDRDGVINAPLYNAKEGAHDSPYTVNGITVATSLLAAVKQILSEEGEP